MRAEKRDPLRYSKQELLDAELDELVIVIKNWNLEKYAKDILANLILIAQKE